MNSYGLEYLSTLFNPESPRKSIIYQDHEEVRHLRQDAQKNKEKMQHNGNTTFIRQLLGLH